jgi:hypothetical protein
MARPTLIDGAAPRIHFGGHVNATYQRVGKLGLPHHQSLTPSRSIVTGMTLAITPRYRGEPTEHSMKRGNLAADLSLTTRRQHASDRYGAHRTNWGGLSERGDNGRHDYSWVVVSLTQLVRRVDRKLPLYGEDCDRGDLRR